MPEWRDATTYSRGERHDPHTWRADYGGGLSVIITSDHIQYRGQWIMHCQALGISTAIMPSESLEKAKGDAEGFVRSTLLGYLKALERDESILEKSDG